MDRYVIVCATKIIDAKLYVGFVHGRLLDVVHNGGYTYILIRFIRITAMIPATVCLLPSASVHLKCSYSDTDSVLYIRKAL